MSGMGSPPSPASPFAPNYDFAKSCARLGGVCNTAPLGRFALLRYDLCFAVAASGWSMRSSHSIPRGSLSRRVPELIICGEKL